MSLIQEVCDKVRQIMTTLHPSMLDDLGVIPALRSHAKQFQRFYPHIAVTVLSDMDEEEIPAALKIVIFRVVQEGLNNIGKHSKASHSSISLLKEGEGLQLKLDDDGHGFDVKSSESLQSEWAGFGIPSMRERTRLSGGTFSIESERGEGTHLSVYWPKRNKIAHQQRFLNF